MVYLRKTEWGPLDGYLRPMRPEEAALFSEWEKDERPYPWTTLHFLDSARSSAAKVLVLEVYPHRVFGFAVVQVAGGEAYLQNFMVLKDSRRTGVGTHLLQKVMMWAEEKGAGCMLLDVDAANQPAIGLYEKAGFQVTEKRPKAYPGGEDALVMRKNL